MPFPDPAREATREAILDPQVGDLFTEILAFWLYVIDVEGDRVTTLECTAPAKMPDDGLLREQSQAEFAKRLSYESIPSYWVRLSSRGNNVEGWKEFVALRDIMEAPVLV